MGLLHAIFINGTVVTGKSTTAMAVGEALEKVGKPHAIIDLDYIRRAWPAPPQDPFHHELELKSLEALARYFVRVGAEVMVLAGVMEEASDVDQYQQALGADTFTVVCLTADPHIIERRLEKRHHDNASDLRWHLRRAPELAEILAHSGIPQHTIAVENFEPAAIAAKVLEVSGISTS